MNFRVVFFLILTEPIYLISADNLKITRTQVIADLFQNYSAFIKPRRNLSEPVDVNLTLHFTSLREIDERLQTMTFIGWMEISWIDDFLILKDGVKSLQLPKSEIWYPDVALFNSIDDPLHISDGLHIILLEHGHVLWYPGRQYSTICYIDIRRFPFDLQKCQVRIGSWQTPIWVQRIVDTGNSLSEMEFDDNGEWEVLDKLTQPEYNENFRISYVRYEIRFRRRFLYPVINTLLPVLLLSFLNTLVFLLPANSGERITMCISVLLSFTVFLTVFNDMMPKISTTISYLSIYLCVQLGMSGLAVMESVYIWRVNHSEKNKTRKSSVGPCDYLNASSPTEDSTIRQDNMLTRDGSFESNRKCRSEINDNITNNNNTERVGSLSSRLTIPSVRQKYSVTEADQVNRDCKLDSSRLDLVCFWVHLCVTLLSTITLLIMFWI
ncbi:neuronal acetylcholine receptor subunit alpha-7-like [Argopecten irradians]|uniref:neuronal acetylcholine receptor subunit alpha-7-like n=1 Tax=Argopecten irradians TaxID=31199 RepID=UPI00371A83BA